MDVTVSNLVHISLNHKKQRRLCACMLPQVRPPRCECKQAHAHTFAFALTHMQTCTQSADCQICCKLSALMSEEYVAEDLLGPDYREGSLPAQTAMCDNFKGWLSFSMNALGIRSNICKQHATGNVLSSYIPLCAQCSGHSALQAFLQHNIHTSSNFLLGWRTTTITTFSRTYVILEWRPLLHMPRTSWSIISAQNMVTRSQSGVGIFGRGTGVECVFAIASTQD
jgi:hypothetical protein